MTAHHTVLVSNIIGVERSEITEATPPQDDAPRSLQSMWETRQEMHEPHAPFTARMAARQPDGPA